MDRMTQIMLIALKSWDRWDTTQQRTITPEDEEILQELIEGVYKGSIKLLCLTVFGNHGITMKPGELPDRWAREFDTTLIHEDDWND